MERATAVRVSSAVSFPRPLSRSASDGVLCIAPAVAAGLYGATVQPQELCSAISGRAAAALVRFASAPGAATAGGPSDMRTVQSPIVADIEGAARPAGAAGVPAVP